VAELVQRCCVDCNVAVAADLPGAAHLMLVEGVTYLDPEPVVFEVMLDGWRVQSGPGFEGGDLIEALNDPDHPEHHDRPEWLGLDDAVQFDPTSSTPEQ
jgi:hypothetical protein